MAVVGERLGGSYLDCRSRESASLVSPGHSHTANTRYWHNVSLMVAHHLQHWASIGLPVEWPKHNVCSPNASLLLAHHLQPWLSSKTALAKRLIFVGSHRQLDTLTQCYFNVGTVLMMAQHLTNIGSVHYVDRLEQAWQRKLLPTAKPSICLFHKCADTVYWTCCY